MSELGNISLEQAVSRFSGKHKAYVAFLHQTPAAFGWLASEKARIGELNHEFVLPQGHLYLWNFRTLSDFRGMGIYPRLLQHILVVEKPKADQFWIMHAPENKASQRGILKAGFGFVGKVSVINGGEVILGAEQNVLPLGDGLNALGFKESEEQQASCWNCSSPFLPNRNPGCCCVAVNSECTRNILTSA